MAVVTLTDRPKSVRNRCVMEGSRDCIMQYRTILVLRLIPDKGSSNALSLFIAMRGISNNILVHLPSWHDELRVCKEKSQLK